MMLRHTMTLLPLLALLLGATGCESAYYGAWETFGKHKRDILVDRVEEARDDQQAAREQFQTTLERFIEVTQADVGELESRYNKLNSAYERSESRARAVREQIASVKDVAEDLFEEWEDELAEYTNPELRRASEQKLRETRSRYGQFIAAMERAASKMDPVLAAFRDQVLFLKHNLNAAAVASLETTTANLEQEVARLIQDMERSIAEAEQFIREMQSPA